MKKRSRCKNFSNEEEVELLSLVDDHHDIIESKKSNAATWKEKEVAWRAIAASFGRNTGYYRTPAALKSKYENMKLRTKKEAVADKSGTFSAGRISVVPRLPVFSERLIDMSGAGLLSSYDSDKTTYDCVPDVLDLVADQPEESAGEKTEQVTEHTPEKTSEDAAEDTIEDTTERANAFTPHFLEIPANKKIARKKVISVADRAKLSFLRNEDRRGEALHKLTIEHLRNQEQRSEELHRLDVELKQKQLELLDIKIIMNAKSEYNNAIIQ